MSDEIVLSVPKEFWGKIEEMMFPFIVETRIKRIEESDTKW